MSRGRYPWPAPGSQRRMACQFCYRIVVHTSVPVGFDMPNPPTKWRAEQHECDPRRRADRSEGDLQCPFVTPNGHDGGVLCCMLIAGHTGTHVDTYGYEHGTWELEREAPPA